MALCRSETPPVLTRKSQGLASLSTTTTTTTTTTSSRKDSSSIRTPSAALPLSLASSSSLRVTSLYMPLSSLDFPHLLLSLLVCSLFLPTEETMRALVICVALFASVVLVQADLPIHCLNHQVPALPPTPCPGFPL